jgi:hypothetical protein
MLLLNEQIAIVATIKHQRDARYQSTNADETQASETKDKFIGMLNTVSAAGSKGSWYAPNFQESGHRLGISRWCRHNITKKIIS